MCWLASVSAPRLEDSSQVERSRWVKKPNFNNELGDIGVWARYGLLVSSWLNIQIPNGTMTARLNQIGVWTPGAASAATSAFAG
jgi:hypothetical protein